MTSLAGNLLAEDAHRVSFAMSLISGLPTSSPASTPSSLVAIGLEWQATRGADIALESVTAPQPIGATAPRTSELVQQLHDESGLTWEQLAKLFWVSRRAVHLWASGGTMNGANLRRLTELLGFIRKLPGTTPSERRTAIFTYGENGRSPYDQLVQRSSKDT